MGGVRCTNRTDVLVPTFLALVAGVALRAALRALAALVLVARPADGEAALGARHEGLPVLPRPDLVGAHAARLHVGAPDLVVVVHADCRCRSGGRGEVSVKGHGCG